jgi:hypothetical protein
MQMSGSEHLPEWAYYSHMEEEKTKAKMVLNYEIG